MGSIGYRRDGSGYEKGDDGRITRNFGGPGATKTPQTPPRKPTNAPGTAQNQPNPLEELTKKFKTLPKPQRTPELSRPSRTPQVGDSNVFVVPGGQGFDFAVRVCRPGDRFGREGVFVNTGEPIIEFWDTRHPTKDTYSGHLGQFVSSYYASTFLEGREGGRGTAGLDLDGGVPSWTIDGDGVRKVADEFIQRAGLKKTLDDETFNYSWDTDPTHWEDNKFGCNSCDVIGGVVDTRAGYCPDCLYTVVYQSA